MTEIELFDDKHIIEIEEFKNSDYHFYYFISKDPYKAITQKLILEEHVDSSDFACLEFLKNIDTILFINYLFVNQESRNQNIGTQLLKNIEKIAISENVNAILLISSDQDVNFRTLNFYKKQKFQNILEMDNLKNLMFKALKL